MTIYGNFFSPQTVAMLFCLHEAMREIKEGEGLLHQSRKDKIVSFIIQKILMMTDASHIQTGCRQFQAQLLETTGDAKFAEKYDECIRQVDGFNVFYREVSKMLKTLRCLHTSKLEQGNLVDFLVRRMYIYFEKLDFREVVIIYEQFKSYLQEKTLQLPQHQFMLAKSIEQVKFNLQNYSIRPDPNLAAAVNKLAADDNTYKTSYLRGILRAEESVPVESTHEIHRYFDRCLGNLFQEKTEMASMSNKINHCILSSAFISLKMGHLQECLQAVSEGLRISQNNTDEESINNCIVYLYKVAHQLGRHQEQILLTEHAINHSVGLSNSLLMVYSCFTYSFLELHHDCNAPSLALLKNSHLSWTDALHLAKKKIYSQFQSNCKNIYHSYRSLLIPVFMHKLALLLHLPYLKPLLLNTYFQGPELEQLQAHQQFTKSTPLHKLLKAGQIQARLGQKKILVRTINQLKVLEAKVQSPLEIIETWKFINGVKFSEEADMECFENAQKLIQFCRKYGFIKLEIAQQENLINKILIRNGLYEDALVRLQENLRLCISQNIRSEQVVCRLLQARANIELGQFGQPLALTESVEQSGELTHMSNEDQWLFFETKLILNSKIAETLRPHLQPSEISILKQNQLQCLRSMLQFSLDMINLHEIGKCLQKMLGFLAQDDVVGQRVRRALDYCSKARRVFAEMDYDICDNEQMGKRVVRKLRGLYEC